MAVHKRCGSGYFNPRSREGSDWRDQKWWNYVIISIRAPAKGATAIVAAGILVWKFQSALPRRERLNRSRQYRWMYLYFNPRSREGSDLFNISLFWHIPNFNPRSREGSDYRHCRLQMRLYRFQSALPRRERRCKRGQSRYESEFQSALPRRERPADATTVSWNPRFQSALPRRERRLIHNC